MFASLHPWRTNAWMSSERPSSFGLPPRHKQIAHTMLDLPVPFGPITTFSRGPGATVVSLHVKKLRIVTFLIIPRRYDPDGLYADGSIADEGRRLGEVAADGAAPPAVLSDSISNSISY